MTETPQNPARQSRARRASPAYQRIENDLRARIKSGQWAAGVMLPSRRHLAAEYAVSLPTLERAVGDLLADGTLKAQGRKGTVVAQSAKPGKSPTKRVSQARQVGRTVSSAHFSRAVTVGIVSTQRPVGDQNIQTSWKNTIINALERSVTDAGGTARYFDLNRPASAPTTPAEAMLALRAEGVDAVAFVFEEDPHSMTEVIACAEKEGIPLVFVFSRAIRQPVSSVYYDSRDAGLHAAAHLLRRGCRNLLFFAPYTADWVTERLVGAREAVQLAGLPEEVLSVSIAALPLGAAGPQFDHEGRAYAEARRLLSQEGAAADIRARGVIAANDNIAYGFMRAAQEKGLKAGQDYAIVGFDDEPRSRVLGLTTLHPPLEALGQEAGLLLLHAVSGEKMRRVCLHSHLVARTSSFLPASPHADVPNTRS